MRSELLSLVRANWPGIAEKGSASLWRARASRLASRAGNTLRALFRPSEPGPVTPVLIEEPTEDCSTDDAGQIAAGEVSLRDAKGYLHGEYRAAQDMMRA